MKWKPVETGWGDTRAYCAWIFGVSPTGILEKVVRIFGWFRCLYGGMNPASE